MNASNVTGAKGAATAAKNKILQDLMAQLAGIDANQSEEDARLQQLLITLGVNPNAPKPTSPAGLSPDILAELQASLGGLNFGSGFVGAL
jgi:hypothetical protein